MATRPWETIRFPEKKLEARHFEHPGGRLPRVFISELKLGTSPIRCGDGEATDRSDARRDSPGAGIFPFPVGPGTSPGPTMNLSAERASMRMDGGIRISGPIISPCWSMPSRASRICRTQQFPQAERLQTQRQRRGNQGIARGLSRAILNIRRSAEVSFADGTHRFPPAITVCPAAQDARRPALQRVCREVGRQDLREDQQEVNWSLRGLGVPRPAHVCCIRSQIDRNSRSATQKHLCDSVSTRAGRPCHGGATGAARSLESIDGP